MPETDLLAQAHDLLPAMVDAVEALVSQESPSADLDACAAIVQEAIGAFSAWLPSPARVEVHEGRPVWRWGPAQPRVLLLGHLDTVWPIGSLARLPFTNDGQRMTGPGIFDMKAGVVQGWAALALAGMTEDSGVGMLLTTDEEIGSHASRGVIADAIVRAKAVLVLEPSVESALKTARKGTSWYVVDIEGRAAHAGLDPERGVNALVAAAELVLAAPGWADAERGTTVTPTLLTSGTTANTVPAQAQLTLDVRAWTSAEQLRVDERMREWQPSVHGAHVDITGGIDRPALEQAAAARLFGIARAQATAIGLAPPEGRAVGGASDGNLTAAAGVPTLDGLGPVGDGAHADHEWVSVPGMAERAALVAAMITTLLAEEDPVGSTGG
jgi:glutamate carboxypeptidase